MYELVKPGQQRKPPISKSRRQGRAVSRGLSLLVATVCLASLVIGSILSSIEHEGQEHLLRSSKLQNTSSQIMLQFRWMVQSWKNVLLRGHSEADRNQYWHELEEHHQSALHLAQELRELTRVEERPLLDAFVANQEQLLHAYADALVLAQASASYDYRAADNRVRGLDRQVLVPLEKLVERVQKLEEAGYEQHFVRIKKIQWATLTFFLGLLIGLWIVSSYFIRLRVTKEEALEFQNAKLQILGRMSANIIHEIKNPITIIDGRCQQLDLIVRRLKFPEAQVMQDHLRSVFKVNERIVKLIQSISRYTRFSEDLPMAPLRFTEILEDVELIVKSRLTDLNIRLDVQAPSNPSPVLGRDIEISQVLVNLIVNASDAIEELSDRWVRLEITEQAEYVEFRVHDSGSGIPKATLQKLARNFYTTKSVGKGTGQGLAIIRRIVAEHGGYFAYDDALSHTCFIVGLPKNNQKAA